MSPFWLQMPFSTYKSQQVLNNLLQVKTNLFITRLSFQNNLSRVRSPFSPIAQTNSVSSTSNYLVLMCLFFSLSFSFFLNNFFLEIQKTWHLSLLKNYEFVRRRLTTWRWLLCRLASVAADDVIISSWLFQLFLGWRPIVLRWFLYLVFSCLSILFLKGFSFSLSIRFSFVLLISLINVFFWLLLINLLLRLSPSLIVGLLWSLLVL